MTPELVAAIRSGALPAVERIVFDMVREAYLNGRKGIEEELQRMTENRDTWRALAFEAKTKIVAQQAALLGQLDRIENAQEIVGEYEDTHSKDWPCLASAMRALNGEKK